MNNYQDDYKQVFWRGKLEKVLYTKELAGDTAGTGKFGFEQFSSQIKSRIDELSLKTGFKSAIDLQSEKNNAEIKIKISDEVSLCVLFHYQKKAFNPNIYCNLKLGIGNDVFKSETGGFYDKSYNCTSRVKNFAKVLDNIELFVKDFHSSASLLMEYEVYCKNMQIIKSKKAELTSEVKELLKNCAVQYEFEGPSWTCLLNYDKDKWMENLLFSVSFKLDNVDFIAERTNGLFVPEQIKQKLIYKFSMAEIAEKRGEIFEEIKLIAKFLETFRNRDINKDISRTITFSYLKRVGVTSFDPRYSNKLEIVHKSF